jgi:hypothetical protein
MNLIKNFRFVAFPYPQVLRFLVIGVFSVAFLDACSTAPAVCKNYPFPEDGAPPGGVEQPSGQLMSLYCQKVASKDEKEAAALLTQAQDLIVKTDPVQLASEDTCAERDRMNEHGLFSRADQFPPFELACARYYWQEKKDYRLASTLFESVLTTDDVATLIAAEDDYDRLNLEISEDRGEYGRSILGSLSGDCPIANSPALGLSDISRAYYMGSAFQLPENLLAETPGQVRMLVCLEKAEEIVRVCRYVMGSTATLIQESWHIQLIGVRSKSILYTRTFKGSVEECPVVVSAGSHQELRGYPPNRVEVITWIEESLAQANQSIFPIEQETTFHSRRSNNLSFLDLTQWPLVIADPFDDNTNSWTLGISKGQPGGSGQLDRSIKNGKYRWRLRTGEMLDFYGANSSLDSAGNFIVSVDARVVSGRDSTTPFGVAFRRTDEGFFYIFVVNDTGNFRVTLYKDGWTSLIGWTKTFAYKPGESNRLTVRAVGSNFDFWINDELVGKVENNELVQGSVGLVLEDYHLDAVVEFDNFVVRSSEDLLLISNALVLAKRGEVHDALDRFFEIQKLHPDRKIQAGDWNDLCWFGSLWEQAADVMDACEQAVELAPETGYHYGSRGLAKALTGDYQNAVDDFRIASEWWRKNNPEAGWHIKFDNWIAGLEDGRNPFDKSTLIELRE